MSDVPFGFGASSGDEGDEPESEKKDGDAGSGAGGGPPAGSVGPFGFGAAGPHGDPLSALFGGAGLDPANLGAAFQRLGQLMSWQGGPVNWDLARDVARQAVAAGGDKSVKAADREAVADAVRLAELWLDEATALPAGTTGAVGWSRAEWVEGTLPAWRDLVEPVAARVAEAMGTAITANVPEEMRPQIQAMAGPMQQLMRSMGGAMFGAQIGQAVGGLAGEVVGSTDVGLPLGPSGRAVLVPANVAAFGEGLGLPADQVRLYLALREAAHHRLFGHVPWLRGRLVAAVEDYGRGISIDTSKIEEQLSHLDPTNIHALQEALSAGLFQPQNTPAQEQALRRLEGLLALIEGWVDEVVDTAATPRLASAAALRETLRRRRALGGPAEETFAALVGLELRPRRLRAASDLWHRLGEQRGTDARDGIWSHPDLMPTSEDIDDPEAFLSRGDTVIDLSDLGASAEADTDGSEGRQADNRPGDHTPGDEPGKRTGDA